MTAANETMIQYFHWYTPGNSSLWKEVSEKAEWLSTLGFSMAWLPPAYKAAAGSESVGYDVYDLYDLGEFDQKGTIPTKYGNLEQLRKAIHALRKNNIKVIADIVVNHKAGGDELEKFAAVKVDKEDRTKVISDVIEVEAYTKFTFPGRGKKYSNFEWNYECFSGVDHVHGLDDDVIYSIINSWGDDWEDVIDVEKGNYDYLMFNDIEFRNPAVREELFKWAMWYREHAGFDGVRLDAVKHISPRFFREWLHRLREAAGTDIFAVGEYWAPGLLPLLLKYDDATEEKMHLFDSSLQHNFHIASGSGNDYDMRRIFDETFTKAKPHKSVTVVDNHDTQPLQALEAPVEHWFKPLAYALTLLRAEGIPCVFYPDLFGASYTDKGNDGNDHEIFLNKVSCLELLLQARKLYAYGEQHDYFDHVNCIGFTRLGTEDKKGCAVVLSNGDEGHKTMQMGVLYANKTFVDLLQHRTDEIVLNEQGEANFLVNAGSVSVWVEKA